MGWWIIGFSYHMMGKSMANREVMEKIYGLRDFSLNNQLYEWDIMKLKTIYPNWD